VTRFLTLRTHDQGGSVKYPQAVDCDPAVTPPAYRLVPDAEVRASVANKHVVMAIHGFNVSRPHGVGSLGALETALALPNEYAYFGVLWPGDSWLPVVDYPFEAAHAVTAGEKLATYVADFFGLASSISFISHSLGGRVLLEAVQDLKRPAEQLCIAAGAVDRDCMVKQYLGAAHNARRTAVLSSKKDKVLKLAYPAGDFISDVLLGDNDSPWTIALGLKGPPPPVLAPLFGNAIPELQAYDHGDYFPPSGPPFPPAPGKWVDAVKYMRRIVTGQDGAWPP
jgi:hypothetical protein